MRQVRPPLARRRDAPGVFGSVLTAEPAERLDLAAGDLADHDMELRHGGGGTSRIRAVELRLRLQQGALAGEKLGDQGIAPARASGADLGIGAVGCRAQRPRLELQRREELAERGVEEAHEDIGVGEGGRRRFVAKQCFPALADVGLARLQGAHAVEFHGCSMPRGGDRGCARVGKACASFAGRAAGARRQEGKI